MSDASPPTFLFADLAGFTALTEAHGDEPAADVAADFCQAVGEMLPEHEAQLVKTIGDAVMVHCPRAALAVSLGMAVVERVGGRHGLLDVRVGMHTGPAAQRSGDWFGATVNLAARVSAAATAGQTLLTAATRGAAGEVEGLRLVPRGRRKLRNVAEPVELFAAVRTAESSSPGLPIDPICRMAVDPQHSAGVLRHREREYHFCSLECARVFAQDPDERACCDT